MTDMRELSPVQRSIAEKFKLQFDKDGWSYALLTEEMKKAGADVSVSGLQKMLTAQRGIGMETAMRLSEVLGVPWIDLFQPQQSENAAEQVRGSLEFVNRRINASMESLELVESNIGGLGIFFTQMEKTLAQNQETIDGLKVRDALWRLADPETARLLIGQAQNIERIKDELDELQTEISRVIRELK